MVEDLGFYIQEVDYHQSSYKDYREFDTDDMSDLDEELALSATLGVNRLMNKSL